VARRGPGAGRPRRVLLSDFLLVKGQAANDTAGSDPFRCGLKNPSSP